MIEKLKLFNIELVWHLFLYGKLGRYGLQCHMFSLKLALSERATYLFSRNEDTIERTLSSTVSYKLVAVREFLMKFCL